MRLVIDLQGAQGASVRRGIGRYSRELALAMARAPRGHDPVVLLNGTIVDSCGEVAGLFGAELPREALHSWYSVPRSAYLASQPAVRAASERIRAETILSLSADLVHVSSMMEGVHDDCVTAWPGDTDRVPTVATFYDAIPLIRQKDYLEGIWKPIAPWFYRHAEELRRCEGLLAISDSAGSEAVDWLDCDRLRVFDIRAGYDKRNFRPVCPEAGARAALLRRYQLREGFILMVGAADPRKNDLRLAEAYASLPTTLQQRHQLVIVGSERGAQLRRLAGRAQRNAQTSLVLIDHVPDDDLPSLYALCALSVMPSEHEGFGLPALEAMACGAAVIASNTTSLPEVVGEPEALFDPYSVSDIAARLRRALTDEPWRARLAAHGLRRAALFGWDKSAELAWDAIEEIHDRGRAARRHSLVVNPVAAAAPPVSADAITTRHRPTLAFVSPLPPDETGIADYARDLLPDLGRHYDITLVTASGTVGDARLAALFPVLGESEFLASARHFDRVLYQVGNSPFHTRMVTELLPARPGVVVLHDAYLGNLPWVTLVEGGDRDRFARAVFESHGWAALSHLQAGRERDITAPYPMSLPVWRDAVGVIQHSRHATEISARFFGAAAVDSVALLPHPKTRRLKASKPAARAELALFADLFVCCTFGIVADTKRPFAVLEAWAEALRHKPEAVLAYVGGIAPDLRAELLRQAEALSIEAHRLIVTDRVDEATYRLWLNAADCAIQLREGSRGETSAAISDCLTVGLPVVANAHGSAAELPPDMLVLLDDEAETETVAGALSGLYRDRAAAEALGRRAEAYAREEYAPARVAALYRDAIERMWASGRIRSLERVGVEARQIPDVLLPDLARSLARSFPPALPRRLLLDATNMAKLDLGTGIQRVIREIAIRVMREVPQDWRAETTFLDGVNLRHARSFAARLLDLPAGGLEDHLVECGPGDVIVLMDHHGDLSAAESDTLRRLQRQGARIVLVVYDILPLRHPAWFPAEVVPALQHWPREVLGFADAALCISRSVADDVRDWLDDNPGLRRRPLLLDHFPLGANFAAPAGASPAPPPSAARRMARQHPALLMVGTVEPRKGHAQVLAAYEILWARGVDIGLTIVGKEGWLMGELAATLRAHPEFGRRLHWLDKVDDAELTRLYAGHGGLLMASEGEGFGLPLIEAAYHGASIVCRDLPVFREVAGDNAVYFDGTAPADLARGLEDWLRLRQTGGLPDPSAIRPYTWDEAAAAFLRPLLGWQWRDVCMPSQPAPEGDATRAVSETPAAATA